VGRGEEKRREERWHLTFVLSPLLVPLQRKPKGNQRKRLREIEEMSAEEAILRANWKFGKTYTNGYPLNGLKKRIADSKRP